MIGESIPGGTTTALGVLSALGVKAEGKVSSTLPENPHSLKAQTVKAGLKAAGESFGSLAKDPAKAISCVGDPMMAAFSGLSGWCSIAGSSFDGWRNTDERYLSPCERFEPDVLCNVAVGTTRWVAKDKSSDLKGIVTQFCDVPILAADLNFGSSRFPGLQIYETGLVKEGVGAGGASIAAMAKLGGAVTADLLLKEIERNYALLMGLK